MFAESHKYWGETEIRIFKLKSKEALDFSTPEVWPGFISTIYNLR